MYSIPRHLEKIVRKLQKTSKSVLVTGQRQVGKSTLLEHLFPSERVVTFDDALQLSQASDDPGLFLLNNPAPLLIDEVQKCPSIFSHVKLRLDQSDDRGQYLFTGSQKLQLMEGVSDSLAGRVSIVEMEGLSLREIYRCDFNQHFVPTQAYLAAREKKLKKYGSDIWKTIHLGSYPELYAGAARQWMEFYRSYVSTYLERDVNKLLLVKNRMTFVAFMTALAARTGQIVNYANIAHELGVAEKTIKEWLSILERSGIVYLLKPYCPTALKRALKSPKVYFRDTGLACYLTRWLTPESLKNGAMAGAMFETFVVNEILKSFSNEGLDYDFGVYFYNGRDRRKRRIDGVSAIVDSEVDLIIEEDGVLYPIEIKLSASPRAEMALAFDVLDGVPERKRGLGVIICMYAKKAYLRENLVALPIEYI